MNTTKKLSKKTKVLLEYIIFLIIPLSIFIFVTIRNKSRIEQSEKANKTNSEQIINTESSIENNLINQGLQYINQKKYKESIEINLKVITINPQNITAYNNIGIAYANMQQWDKGIEYCSKALAIDPNFQLAKNNINWMKSEKEKQTP